MKYLNLDDNKTKNTIGILDNSNKNYLNIVKKIKNEVISDNIEEYLKQLFTLKKYDLHSLGEVLSVFKKYFKSTDRFDDFLKLQLYDLKYYNNEVTRIPLSDISNHYIEYIDHDFFNELANIPLKGVPVVGKGEGLLGLFTHIQNSTTGGDLHDPLYNNSIESKGPKARLAGCNVKTRTSMDCLNDLKLLLESKKVLFEPPTKGIGDKLVKELVKLIKNNNVVLSNDFLNDLINCFRQYKNMFNTTIHISILKNILKETEVNINYLKSYLTALHMEEYKNLERMNYIFFFGDKYDSILSYNVKIHDFEKDVDFVYNNIKTLLSWGSDNIAKSFSVSLK